MATATRWTMRQEPYDPDARDADNDGIVQEQTPWERPAGTRLVDELGRAITRGANATNRPRGLRVVDRNGNTVDYTPTYDRPGGGFGAGGGTPLGEAGAPSLRERGLPTVRDITAPRVAPVQPEATPVGTPEVSQVPRIDPEVTDRAEIPYILGRPLAKSEDEAGIVDPKRFNFQPDEAVKRIRKQLKERLEAETDPERKKILQDFLDRDAEDTRGLILRSVDRGMIDAFDAYEDKDVLIAVPDRDAIKILESGRVKNQLETGTSSAMYQPTKRIDLEEERFGVPRKIDPAKRPIYGWVRAQERKDGTEFEREKISTDIYGRINIRLKPEVRERTTITMGDSAGESRIGVPMLGSARREAVSKWLAKDMENERKREILQFFGRGEDSEHARWLHGAIGGGGFPGQIQSRVEQRLLENHPELRGLLDDPRDFAGGGFGHYIETQIHGGVDVKDIDAIEVPSDVPDEVRQEIERLAKPYGIRVGTAEELKAAVDSPEEPKVPTRRERIKQKNKEILDKIKSVGGSWARVDKEFLEKDAQNAENHHVATPLTPEEAAKFRREFMKQNVLAFQHFLKTGKAPTEDDGFPKWISDQYGYLPAWEDNVSQMPQELRDHIINTDADELIAEAERYALEYHDGLGPPSVRVPSDRLDGILEDGRYKTTHEEFSKHSGASPRREFERQVGIPDDAPDEVRPASGYVVHQDVIDAALKDYLEKNGVEATEFSVLNPKEGAVGIYGDIEMVLDPEVAGRTAYGRGDTLNQMARPARLDSEDPDEIANAVLGTGGMNRSWQLDVMLSFLHAGRSGSYADATDRYSWRGEGKEAGPEYTEALIAGSFDLADVAEVRLHPGSRDVTGIENSLTPVLGHDNGRELVDATRDEFFSPEALSKLDLTDEERAYIEQQGLLNVDANNFGRWPGGTRIEQLFQHRKAKEVEDKLRAAGVQKITHLHESGLNMMDPESFGEESALGTVDEIRAERVRKAIVDDLRRAIERSKRGNTPRSFDVG